METNLEPNTKIYSVDEITTHIKNLIERDEALQDISVEGEISNFRHSNKMHMYFSLKDENSIIECAMFQRANQNLEFMPSDGMKVVVRGYLEVYKPRGTYQIIVEEMHLAGRGKLYLEFLKLKEKLEKEGLFKEDHKKPLPKYPKTIGVITSPEGAVIYDIIKVVKRRYPHVKIILFPSPVQGNEAKYRIVEGIKKLNQICVDVIIIARGGGSFEDLCSFNEEIIARAVYDSKIPIISAIGHETDFTIIDFVADKRAPTPSAAAELVVPDEIEVYNNLSNLENKIYRCMIRVIESYKQRIHYISNRLIFKRPFSLIEGYKQTLDERGIQLKQTVVNKIEILKREVNGFEGKLNALSPYSVLKRGYSITQKDGKIVSSIKNISKGDIIYTIVKDGEIKSGIKNKNERKII
ncbi:MAG: exodeoxyribonuclease VII large subunit [archaeon]